MLVLASCMALALLAMPQIAAAHSSLEESTPAAGSTVDSPLDEIVLTFSDPVTVPDSVISVLDLTGRNYAPDKVEVDGQKVTIPLDGDGTGTRVVAWTVISDHGTPVTGSFEYHVGDVTAGARTEPGANTSDTRRAEATDGLRAITATSLVLTLVACAAAFTARRRRGTTGGWNHVLRGCGIVAASAGFAGAVAAVENDVRVALLLGAIAAAIAVVLATRAACLAAVVGSVLLLVGIGSVVAASPSPPPTQRFEQEVSFGEETSAIVTMEPTVAGFANVDVVVSNADGSPNSDIVAANLRYQPTDESLGNFHTALESTGDGQFVAKDVLVPFDGAWKFELTIAEDRFSAALASFEVTFDANPEVE